MNRLFSFYLWTWALNILLSTTVRAALGILGPSTSKGCKFWLRQTEGSKTEHEALVCISNRSLC